MTVQIDGAPGSQEAQIYLNPEARQWLIAQLNKLDRRDDHFHVFSFEDWDGLQLSDIPYSPNDKTVPALKVLLRQDDWDEQYFPHVMEPPKEP
jgi:hypothetical protein